MNIHMAITRNKQHKCAGCGASGETLVKYFWNEYDFKYCSECLARRKKGITPDWAYLGETEVGKKNPYLKSTDVMEGEG